MVLIKRCCCWKSVRTGSFAAGYYSLILNIIILTGAIFNLNTVRSDTVPVLLFTLIMIGLSGCCVVTSILLLIGLCVDSRKLLVPWMISGLMTTFLDFLGSLYLLFEKEVSNKLFILFCIDVTIVALNTYSLVCVYSQYQEYLAGRGYPVTGRHQAPPVEFRERCFLSGATRITNDSGATNSSSISVVQSSVPTGQNEVSIISEDYQDRYRDGDSCEERETILQNESENLLNVTASSTERIIEPNDSSFVSNTNENSDSAFSQVIDYDTENEERALKD